MYCGAFAPNADGAELDVRVLDGNVRALADGDLFIQRLEREIGLVANMRHVEAVEFCGGACESDDFVRGAVGAHFVFEAAGEADGAFVHGLIDELDHLVRFRPALRRAGNPCRELVRERWRGRRERRD